MSLRVSIDGSAYNISWKHSGPKFPEFSKEDWLKEPVPGTDCIIEEKCGEGWEIAYIGSSILCPGDRFDKEIGRKISLARALRLWPKEKRQLVWRAYLNRREGGMPNW